MDTEQFSETYPCPKCGTDREAAEPNCMCCGWKRVTTADSLPPQPKALPKLRESSVGRTIVTAIVAILCAALGWFAGVLLAILGDAMLHPGRQGEEFFGAGMIGSLYLGPACALAAGIHAVNCGPRGSHLFRFLGIMMLLVIVPIVALACLSYVN